MISRNDQTSGNDQFAIFMLGKEIFSRHFLPPSTHNWLFSSWFEVPTRLRHPCPGLRDMGRIQGDAARRAHPW